MNIQLFRLASLATVRQVLTPAASPRRRVQLDNLKRANSELGTLNPFEIPSRGNVICPARRERSVENVNIGRGFLRRKFGRRTGGRTTEVESIV